jgi:soluble lytic murein transglycosylase-like protein
MGEDSVFQNIGNVLSRIDEIKRRYGVNSKVVYPGFDYLLDREMKIETPEGASGGEPVEQIDENRVKGPEMPENTNINISGKVTAETEGQNTDLYSEIIKEASQRFKIPEQLISAVIKQESGFNRNAVSPKGAMGLMQLMPATASILGVEDPFNAEENIIGGTRYLRELINIYGGNLNKALAAYNAGPQKVDEDIPDIPETRDFIQSVLNYYDTFSKYE